LPTNPTTQISISKINQVLQDLREYTRFGGIFYALENSLPLIYGPGVSRFCAGCSRHPRARGFCQSSACTGAVQGHAIGDVWYCRCWLGLDSVIVPIAPHGEVVGAIEIGGFFSPGDSIRAQQNVLARLGSLDSGGVLEHFVNALPGMPELGFREVKSIADFVLEATFSRGLNRASLFRTRHKMFQQQQRLAEKIARMQPLHNDPYQDVLASLVPISAALEQGMRGQLLSAMDDFLGRVLLTAQGKLEVSKACLLMLSSMLLKYDLDHGMSWQTATTMLEESRLEIDAHTAVEELCAWAENKLLRHCQQSENQRQVPELSISTRVIRWLEEHYPQNVRLDDAAAAISASLSSIVHRLKQETGLTFAQHLNSIRTREAKHLLAHTDLSLGEISRRCGFCDQSYFTKVFRKHINLTPSEFRHILNRQLLK